MRTRRSGFKALTIVLGGLLAAVMISSTSSAVDIIDDPMQIDERAAQLIQSSNSLCWEMHRFHQRQPDFREAYQATKEIWSRARQLRDALRSGTVETEVLVQNMTQIDEIFTQVETSVSKWGNGDRSLVAPNSGPVQRTVVTPGVEIDIPFVGIVGGGSRVMVTDEGPPLLERRRLHPNSRGSKRSLEREVAAVKVALSYLWEDAGVTDQAVVHAADAPEPAVEASEPPRPDTESDKPAKIEAPAPSKPRVPAVRK